MNFEKLKYQYKNELLNNVIPFWLQKSQDLKYGGYFTCLDRQGNILTRINSSGYKAVKYGCFLCYIIMWKIDKNGSIAPSKVVNS